MTTATEPVTHYSPAATERALAGDIHGTIICAAPHWGFVSDDPALVNCEGCKVALAAGAIERYCDNLGIEVPSPALARALAREALAAVGTAT